MWGAEWLEGPNGRVPSSLSGGRTGSEMVFSSISDGSRRA